MTTLQVAARKRALVLRAKTAAELMTRDPLTFGRNTPIHQAAALLDLYELEAAPVVDPDNRPKGVVTRTKCADWQDFCARSFPKRFVSNALDRTPVAEIMRATIEVVRDRDSARAVIEKIFKKRLSRVYVICDEGALVGVVSKSDVLRHLLG